jgi:hypothetical protein
MTFVPMTFSCGSSGAGSMMMSSSATRPRCALACFPRSLEPITAFFDGAIYWLADGYHRVAAAKSVPLVEVEVDVRQGTSREALWYAFGVNAQHGHARSRDDVARILKAIFDDEAWRAVPLREISRHTRIPETTVRRSYSKRFGASALAAASAQVAQIAPKPAVRTVTRGGSTYGMDTGAIGRGKPPAAKGPAAITTPQPVPPIVTEPVGPLRLHPGLPGARAAANQQTDVEAEAARNQFVAAVRPLLDGLIAQGRTNMATMSPDTVAHLTHRLEALLVGWDFADYGRRARRCRLCGERIINGKIVMTADGPAHWVCQQKDEAFQRWLQVAAE